MPIPLCNLKQQYQTYKQEIDSAIARVLNSTAFIMGKEVSDFEEHLKTYLHTKYAVGCASGTDALLLSLRALGIQKNDEVITTPFTFISTASSISRLGATPVFADIDPQTFNLDPASVEQKITKKTKAIIVVHLFGQSCAMQEIMRLAQRHTLKVIEDNAQSLGAQYNGQFTGTIGDIGTLSFFPSKTLGGFGDGGAVVTNNKKLAEQIQLLRVHGSKQRYIYQEIGYNSRLDALQAAILNVKLTYLDKANDLRREKAHLYDTLLSGIREITTPSIAKNNYSVYGQYVIKAQKRDQLELYFQEQQIGCAIYYPVPLHLQPCYRELNYKKGSLPQAEKACRQVFALPMSPDLIEAELKEVVAQIKKFYKQ